MKFVVPITIVALGLLISMLHFFALENSYYWVYSWFDILMHFLGGALVGLFGYFILTSLTSGMLPKENRYLLFIDVLLFSIIVGLLWESYELIFELTETTKVGYLTDTIIDFLMNTVGVIVSYFYFVSIHKKTHG